MAAIVLDLDGTLYHDATPIDGAGRAVAELRADGHRVVFATNDATLSRSDRAGHLSTMGIEARPEEVVTSGTVAAAFVASLDPLVRTVLVLGPDAVAEELLLRSPDLTVLRPELDAAARADAVVVALDRRFDLDRLHAAHSAICRGAHFVATNADAAYPTIGGGTAPGAGALVAALERSTGRAATVVGKPEPFLLTLAAELTGVDAASLVVVGDSATDVAVARRCDATSVLVLTGMVTDAERLVTPPDLVVPSIADVPGMFRPGSTMARPSRLRASR